ncbi:hypothetical protein CMI46_03015 [Candidatus Pacearchaeota archaeon]|nr:hypothetical protein [Candidatus Pacearchaeota archaeon]
MMNLGPPKSESIALIIRLLIIALKTPPILGMRASFENWFRMDSISFLSRDVLVVIVLCPLSMEMNFSGPKHSMFVTSSSSSKGAIFSMPLLSMTPA